MTSVTIMPAASEDAKEILDLQYLAYQAEAQLYNDFSIPPLIQTLAEMQSQFDTHVFLKAVEKNRIIGSVRARIDQGTCLIGRLIVLPDSQGKGIGTDLMAAIEQSFKGCDRYELFTGTKSLDNIRLYQRLGYQPFSEKQVNQGLSLVFLEKKPGLSV